MNLIVSIIVCSSQRLEKKYLHWLEIANEALFAMIITTMVLFSEFTFIEVKSDYGWCFVALKSLMVLINIIAVICFGYRSVYLALVKLKNLVNFYCSKSKNLLRFHFDKLGRKIFGLEEVPRINQVALTHQNEENS